MSPCAGAQNEHGQPEGSLCDGGNREHGRTIASMAFNILGINHKTAPVALREKVACSEDRLAAALRTLREALGAAEAVILSTCNRTRVYWSGPVSDTELSKGPARRNSHHRARAT